MARGGKRDGAGRKAGTVNKASAAKRAEIEASGLTPLDYMLNVMRDETAPIDRRDDMAKAVAPYVHPKLAAMTVGSDPENPFEVNVRLNAERFSRAIARLATRSGKAKGTK